MGKSVCYAYDSPDQGLLALNWIIPYKIMRFYLDL